MNDNMKKFKSKNFLMRKHIGEFRDNVVEMIENKDISRMLDFGSGDGIFTNMIYDKVACKIDCFDVDKKSLEYARERIEHRCIKIIKESEIDTSNYDLITSFEVLEHLEDPDVFFDLLDGFKGRIIISIPNEPNFSRLNLIRLKDLRRKGVPIDHRNTWRDVDIWEMLIKKFIIVEWRKLMAWHIIELKRKLIKGIGDVDAEGNPNYDEK